MKDASRESNDLVRFFITLPDSVPFPDGYRTAVTVGSPDPDEIDGGQPFVHLEFIQSEDISRRYGSYRASISAANRALGLTPPGGDQRDLEMRGQYTTVAATTPSDRKHHSETKWGKPQDAPSSKDAFNRCMEAVSEMVRTYRAAFEVPCSIPTYEQTHNAVLYQFAPAAIMSPNIPGFLDVDACDWGELGLLFLDHGNLPDHTPDGIRTEEGEDRFFYFRRLLDEASPLFLWRERFTDARRALWVEGRYGESVTMGNTASEVLLDGILSLLYWEKREDASNLASVFAEGALVRRLKSKFPGLLGGAWSLDTPGAVSEWFHHAYKLRHRVVHGGYRPSRIEAQRALNAVHSLSLHCLDRIAERRNEFPRAALILISKEGLEQRGKWCTKMQNFHHDVAPGEDPWLEAYGAWRSELSSAQLAELSR
ncbi:hypothetical protein OHT93_17295 [Streptomyces sp. NBC_00191]|uniref:hypothetical protein n=1 Tax=Streptomyces sp. NBC_00191 TaxID=2975674 RepID=UPI0032445126